MGIKRIKKIISRVVFISVVGVVLGLIYFGFNIFDQGISIFLMVFFGGLFIASIIFRLVIKIITGQ